ncbi:hypothetical protein [Bacillus sp. FJAT-45066]|uniref:hypothetical protein n=1 Tax=Bacillus sp. FJAT-45066 TaxID=2011010 RepID=UPI000BB8C3E1|nr:hypothetical protein [Bacillus sp. FJAT-45066]
MNTNYEMVLAGHAVTYFIWPFESDVVEKYGKALKEAKDAGLAIWNPEDPMMEYPFEFRAREGGSTPKRPVGDYRTKYYVPASEWRSVEPEYRVFFHTEEDAISAGYSPMPVSKLAVLQDIKAALVLYNSEDHLYKRSTFNVIFNQTNTVENHALKLELPKNERALQAHNHNYLRALEKLLLDLEKEYSNENLSESAYDAIYGLVEVVLSKEAMELEELAS